jgi:uncharacterized membrane protein YadS
LVKLVRVLLLGPLVVALSVIRSRKGAEGVEDRRLPPLGRLVPWFVIGFLVMALVRSVGVIPDVLMRPLDLAAGALTVLAMAGLGLGVDVRSVASAGFRISAVVTGSLLLLAAMAVGLVRLLAIGS